MVKFGMKMLFGLATILSIIAVGDAIRLGQLAIPFVPVIVNQIVGWFVIAGAVMGILDMFGLRLFKL